jgi:hypothetical protein
LKTPESRILAGLTPSMLVTAIEQSLAEDQTAALRVFRAYFEIPQTLEITKGSPLRLQECKRPAAPYA